MSYLTKIQRPPSRAHFRRGNLVADRSLVYQLYLAYIALIFALSCFCLFLVQKNLSQSHLRVRRSLVLNDRTTIRITNILI